MRQLASMVLGSAGVNPLVGILVSLATAILAILLVVLYVARDLVLLVATVLGPMALATYALPQTDEIARVWGRVFCALLYVQVVQAILIAVAMQLLRRTDWLGGPVSGLTSGLVLLTLLYLLFKLPFAAYQMSFRQPLSQSAPVRTVVVTARALAKVVPLLERDAPAHVVGADAVARVVPVELQDAEVERLVAKLRLAECQAQGEGTGTVCRRIDDHLRCIGDG